jgi:luciferase family oxidoreductase group 1
MTGMPALSVLDLAPVTTATPPSRALRNSIDLARHADALGFRRFWIAEHHNLASVATSAPPVMIGQVAAATRQIRVGSGGVMLPNHAPLVVAEQFRTLEALFPDRIDLGVGRAPGTDQLTMYALRRRMEGAENDDFVERLHELIALGTDAVPVDHPFRQIAAQPSDVPLPPVWILGSSDYGARLAAQMGLGYAFAHHFASFPAEEAMRLYRKNFRPSVWLDAPRAILGVSAVCADTYAEADRLTATLDLTWLRMMRGERAPLVDPDAVLAMEFSAAEREVIARNRARHAIGSPDEVRAKLEKLAADTEADELMVTTMIFDHAARKQSYTLLAGTFGLAAPGA